MLTHLKAAETSHVGPPLVLLVLAILVGLGRRHQVIAPFNRLFAPGGADRQARA